MIKLIENNQTYKDIMGICENNFENI